MHIFAKKCIPEWWNSQEQKHMNMAVIPFNLILHETE